MSMNRDKLMGLMMLAVVATSAAPAVAQVEAGTHELHAYAGELFGDDLTDTEVSGRTPETDDDATYGMRYTYNITDSWGVELSLGQTASSAMKLATHDVDLDLTTVDLDAVWHFDFGARVAPYVVAGIGYVTAELEEPIHGTVDGAPVVIEDDDGFTANAGLGVSFSQPTAFSFVSKPAIAISMPLSIASTTR